MKIRFWLLLSILMLMIGCATAGKQPAYNEDYNEYWYYILYHKSLDQNRGG